MESKDRLKTEAGKVACSSTEVQKLFKHVFLPSCPLFPTLLAHLLQIHTAMFPES